MQHYLFVSEICTMMGSCFWRWHSLLVLKRMTSRVFKMCMCMFSLVGPKPDQSDCWNWQICEKFFAECITARLWMRDLFSQCTCVCMCLSCSGMSICTHSRACSETHVSHALTMEDREELFTAQRTAWVVLHNVRVLRSRVLNAADGWRHWERESNKVNVQKKPRRQKENQIKCKRKKHVVESLHKPGIHKASCACVILVLIPGYVLSRGLS